MYEYYKLSNEFTSRKTSVCIWYEARKACGSNSRFTAFTYIGTTAFTYIGTTALVSRTTAVKELIYQLLNSCALVDYWGLEPTNKRNIAIKQLQHISRPSFLSCRRTWKGLSAAAAHVDVLASACGCVPSFDRPRQVRRTHNRPRNRRTDRSAIQRRRIEQARRSADCFCSRCCWSCRRYYWSCCRYWSCYRCYRCCWERVLLQKTGAGSEWSRSAVLPRRF